MTPAATTTMTRATGNSAALPRSSTGGPEYDVPAKQTEVFYTLLARYLTHEQNSVFVGRLTEGVYRTMMAGLSKVAREDERLLSIVVENQNNVRVCKLRKSGDNGRLDLVPAKAHGHGFDTI